MSTLGAQPLVSVVIPCYNHGRYLPEAVASVVGQTFHDWEIVIVDDGSADNSAAVAEQQIACYPDRAIRLLHQPNMGLGASRNNGIRASSGSYILPLDADDRIAPELLAATTAVLDAQPAVGFVYTSVQFFGEETAIWSGGAYSVTKLRFDCLMAPETLFRRQLWEAVGGFGVTMQPQGFEDWDFWLRLAAAGWQGWHIARPLVHYRRSSASMLTATRRHDLELRAQIILNHPQLYEPAFVDWARQAGPPGASDHSAWPRGRWLRSFASYALLIARYHPRLLAKTLARPLFCRLSVRQQRYARRLGHALRINPADPRHPDHGQSRGQPDHRSGGSCQPAGQLPHIE